MTFSMHMVLMQVAFGDKTSPVYNADGLVLLYKKRPFVIYMGLAFAIGKTA